MSTREIAMTVLAVLAIILLFAAGGIQAVKGFAKGFNGSKHFLAIYSWAQALAVVLAAVCVGILLYLR